MTLIRVVPTTLMDMRDVHAKYGNHTYRNVITAIDKIPTYLLRFNSGLVEVVKDDIAEKQCT